MRAVQDPCGCFPTGRHYPGIAEILARAAGPVVGLAAEYDGYADWRSIPLAVLDFETTGLDPERDRVIEIGIAVFENGVCSEIRNWLVYPGMPVPEESRAVHGITDEELQHAPRFEGVVHEVLATLQGKIPVAYNAEFDRRFLRAELLRTGHPSDAASPPAARSDVSWVDPLVWVRELDKYESSQKLTEVCARYSVALERAHRAAGDAEAAGKVLLALAPRMPKTYGELVRIQQQYAARQDVDFAALRGMRR